MQPIRQSRSIPENVSTVLHPSTQSGLRRTPHSKLSYRCNSQRNLDSGIDSIYAGETPYNKAKEMKPVYVSRSQITEVEMTKNLIVHRRIDG